MHRKKRKAAALVGVCVGLFCLGALGQTGLPDGYGQLAWGVSPNQATKIIDKEVNAPGFLAVAMKNHIKEIIEQYKQDHPDLKPPSAEEFDDQFDPDDFKKDIFYDELSVYGERPQYYKDLLGPEIELNAGEGVIAVEDKPTILYLFAGKKLWKVVVIHSEAESAKLSFKAFIDKLTEKYGPPAKVESTSGNQAGEKPAKALETSEKKKAGEQKGELSKERVLKAIWENSTTRLEARAEKNGYREIYVSKAILSNIDAIRKQGRKKFKGL
ncbi:MAG: hypothetical protein GXP49_11140 [Deltaproteobacteria bacterium]|nr:hypothetical protein [Deltaproteobacteria bacterium]